MTKTPKGCVWDCPSHPKGGWEAHVHFDDEVAVGTYLVPADRVAALESALSGLRARFDPYALPGLEANEAAAAAADAALGGVAPPAQGDVVVTWDEAKTRIVAVTRQDAEGRVLSVIAEAPAQRVQPTEIDWSQAGPLMEAAASAKHAGFTAGTTNWAAHVYRQMLKTTGKQAQAEAVPASVKVAFQPGGNPDEQFDFSALLRPSIDEMAVQAGAARFYPGQQSTKDDAYIVSRQFLERFAELVARRGQMELDHG